MSLTIPFGVPVVPDVYKINNGYHIWFNFNYEGKTTNQFVGVDTARDVLSVGDDVRYNNVAYGYSFANISKKIEVLITGVLKDFPIPDETISLCCYVALSLIRLLVLDARTLLILLAMVVLVLYNCLYILCLISPSFRLSDCSACSFVLLSLIHQRPYFVHLTSCLCLIHY